MKLSGFSIKAHKMRRFDTYIPGMPNPVTEHQKCAGMTKMTLSGKTEPRDLPITRHWQRFIDQAETI